MTQWFDDPKYLKILETLLREEEMTFQQIAVKVGNRNAASNRIKLLLREGAVRDLAGGRGQGQAARYVLTDKGERIAQAVVLDNYADVLKVLHTFVLRLSNDPEKLLAFREQLNKKHKERSEQERVALIHENLKRHSSSKKIITYDPDGTPKELDNWIAEYFDRPKKLVEDDLITISLRALFEIYVQVHFRPEQKSPGGYVVGFPQKGGLCLIPVSILKKAGIKTGL